MITLTKFMTARELIWGLALLLSLLGASPIQAQYKQSHGVFSSGGGYTLTVQKDGDGQGAVTGGGINCGPDSFSLKCCLPPFPCDQCDRLPDGRHSIEYYGDSVTVVLAPRRSSHVPCMMNVIDCRRWPTYARDSPQWRTLLVATQRKQPYPLFPSLQEES